MQKCHSYFRPPPLRRPSPSGYREPPIHVPFKIGVNKPCPCGSGKKYKKCCLNSDKPNEPGTSTSISVIQALATDRHNQRTSDPTVSRVDNGLCTTRMFRGKLVERPKSELYLEFVLDALVQTLGSRWCKKELNKPRAERHAVINWLTDAKDNLKVENIAKGLWPETYDAYVLADDLYRLQIYRKIPSPLRARLIDKTLFQGVRYEIAVASIFARSGFDLDWINDRSVKHCEFTAVHRGSGEAVAVEAKSRHRPGILHQAGSGTPQASPSSLQREDIKNLLRRALQQGPGDKPFIIFVDVNLPHEADARLWGIQWLREVKAICEETLPPDTPSSPSPCSLFVFTNLAWYCHRRDKPKGAPELVFMIPPHCRHPLKNRATVEDLRYVMNHYGTTDPIHT